MPVAFCCVEQLLKRVRCEVSQRVNGSDCDLCSIFLGEMIMRTKEVF